MKLRYLEEKIIFGICLLAAIVTSILLIIIIGTIALKGFPALNLYFLFTPESATEGLGRGILNALVGSVLLSLFSTLIATPLAFGTAIYLQKYSREGSVTRSVRFFIEVLSGTPSIVLGIFGLFLLVYYMRAFTGGFSLLAGSIALAILILPVIERAIESAIASIPSGLEEGSYALGATKWQTIRYIVIPASLAGIVTGVILGFGRAAEESAVVVLTAGYTQFLPEFGIKPDEKLAFGVRILPFQDIVGTLPIFVYHGYQNSMMIPVANTFAAAFVLICFVLLVNLTAKTIFWYSTRTRGSSTPLFSSLARTLSGVNGGIFRRKHTPVPPCAAAEAAGAEKDGQIWHARGTTHAAKVTPSFRPMNDEVDWRETLARGLRVDEVPAGGAAPVPDEDLFEPADFSTPHTGDPHPAGTRGDPYLAGRAGGIPRAFPTGDDLLKDAGESLLEELPAARGIESGAPQPGEPILMTEDGEENLPVPPDVVPVEEAWRRMAKNRLENTVAGITADPWEWA